MGASLSFVLVRLQSMVALAPAVPVRVSTQDSYGMKIGVSRGEMRAEGACHAEVHAMHQVLFHRG